MNNNKLTFISILGLVLALVLGGVAIATAMRMSSQPSVSPTVPQSKPRASEVTITPACGLTFTIQSPAEPICTALTMSPNQTTLALTEPNTRVFTASSSGGFGNITYAYAATNTGGAGIGTFASVGAGSNPNSKLWTAPDLTNTTTLQTWVITAKAKDSLGKESAVGNCTQTITYTPQIALKCVAVTLTPSDPTLVGGSETRKLTATASGGMGSLKYSWVATGGTLSSTTGQNVTWTSPASFSSSQTFTVTATVSDDAGKTATSDSCKVSLGYTYNPSCNSNCQNSAGCPNDLACSSGRCRNPSCVDSSDCKCPPPLKVCNETCLVNSECSKEFICAGGNCRNPSCITQSGCTCPAPVPNVPPTPTPAPVVSTHKTCKNNACVVVNGAGADTCTSDVSCAPAAIPPKIPESGVSLPTMLGIIGGIGLLFLGILVVL